MKCCFCENEFEPTDKDQTVCEDCSHSIDEMSDGKGEDEDE